MLGRVGSAGDRRRTLTELISRVDRRRIARRRRSGRAPLSADDETPARSASSQALRAPLPLLTSGWRRAAREPTRTRQQPAVSHPNPAGEQELGAARRNPHGGTFSIGIGGGPRSSGVAVVLAPPSGRSTRHAREPATTAQNLCYPGTIVASAAASDKAKPVRPADRASDLPRTPSQTVGNVSAGVRRGLGAAGGTRRHYRLSGRAKKNTAASPAAPRSASPEIQMGVVQAGDEQQSLRTATPKI